MSKKTEKEIEELKKEIEHLKLVLKSNNLFYKRHDEKPYVLKINSKKKWYKRIKKPENITTI